MIFKNDFKKMIFKKMILKSQISLNLENLKNTRRHFETFETVLPVEVQQQESLCNFLWHLKIHNIHRNTYRVRNTFIVDVQSPSSYCKRRKE